MTRKYIMFRSTPHPSDAPCVGEVFGCPQFERLSEGRRHGSNWGELATPWWNKTPHGFQGLTPRNFLQRLLQIKKGPFLWWSLIFLSQKLSFVEQLRCGFYFFQKNEGEFCWKDQSFLWHLYNFFFLVVTVNFLVGGAVLQILAHESSANSLRRLPSLR